MSHGGRIPMPVVPHAAPTRHAAVASARQRGAHDGPGQATTTNVALLRRAVDALFAVQMRCGAVLPKGAYSTGRLLCGAPVTSGWGVPCRIMPLPM
jgi:hypothetical protein